MLTEKEKEVLESIIDYISENEYPPSVREIGEIVGLSSSSKTHAYLNSLQDKGYIYRKKGSPRAIRILKTFDTLTK